MLDFLRGSPLAQELVRMIETEPEKWKVGGHRASYGEGFPEIWIANKAYGLRVRVDAAQQEVRPSWLDRQVVWLAVKRTFAPKSSRQLELERATRTLTERARW